MAGNRKDMAGAKVDLYDGTLGGASYSMKAINQVDGDWDFRKLHLFHPDVILDKLDLRKRRHLRRHQARMQLLASPKSEAHERA